MSYWTLLITNTIKSCHLFKSEEGKVKKKKIGRDAEVVSTERSALTLNWLSDTQQPDSSAITLELVVSPCIILVIKFIAAFIAKFLRSQWSPKYPGAHWQMTFVPSDLHVPPFWQGLLGWHRLAPIWHDKASVRYYETSLLINNVKKPCILFVSS